MPSGQEGGPEWDWGKKQLVWSKLGLGVRDKHSFGDSGVQRAASSSAGLGQFPETLGLGVGLASKMGFLLPNGIFRPPLVG